MRATLGITIILQSMSQLESKYDKKAQTIVDCCDSTLFLGGKSNSTNKEIAEMIGKQTINQMTYGESTGQSGSASKNLQIQGRDLIDAAEIGKMSRKKAILLIAGTNPLMDEKYDPHAHRRYCYIVDKRNKKRLHKDSFDFKSYLRTGHGDWKRIVLDTETTGLHPGEGEGDEILTLSVVDGHGDVLYDGKYRPRWNERWDAASKVNGIWPQDVADPPTIEADLPRIREIVGSADEIVAYNAKFDLSFLKCVGVEPKKDAVITDTMAEYAAFAKVPRANGRGFRNFKLTEVAEAVGHQWTGKAHGSLADAQAALAVQDFLDSRVPRASA